MPWCSPGEPSWDLHCIEIAHLITFSQLLWSVGSWGHEGMRTRIILSSVHVQSNPQNAPSPEHTRWISAALDSGASWSLAVDHQLGHKNTSGMANISNRVCANNTLKKRLRIFSRKCLQPWWLPTPPVCRALLPSSQKIFFQESNLEESSRSLSF
jgi:hypothetical protein